jgi:hypothetical protein
VTTNARLQKLEAASQSAERLRPRGQDSQQVLEAIRDPHTWTRKHTKTYNPHWKEEGRPTPYEPFPDLPYFEPLFEFLESERIVWIEKSRDLMISWACVAFLTYKAMITPECQVLLQTQKLDKAVQLVEYAKCLYDKQDRFLKDAFPLTKSIRKMSKYELTFANGSEIVGIPGGASQIRSYHPWGYLLDEASFVAEAGECYNNALSAAKGSIILNSSAGPGWYADARRGIIDVLAGT